MVANHSTSACIYDVRMSKKNDLGDFNWSVKFCCHVWMVGSELNVKGMKAWIDPTVHPWAFLGTPVKHHLNTTAYPSIAADHVHPCMTTVHPSIF